MTTLFSHFLAQVLGCASTENVHNLVRTRLMFTPDHGLSNSAIDDFILNGTQDMDQLKFWAETLSIELDLLKDAASVAARSAVQQSKRLPDLQLSWTGQTANLKPNRRIQVRVRVGLEEHPLRERFERSGTGLLERATGYTLGDLNRAGAMDQVLMAANAHWHDVEQITGLSAESIHIELEALPV